MNYGLKIKLHGKFGKKLILNKKFWKNKKVFITGHTGFKGTWLFLFLKELGANVHGYSINYAKNKHIFTKKNLIKLNTIGDVKNYNKLEKTILNFKPEIIIHLAAQPLVIKSYKDPYETFITNMIGTLNIINISKKLKKIKSICIITTDKVYEDRKYIKAFKENDNLAGVDPYSASKVSAEIIAKSYFDSYFKKENISLFTTRAGNVIGGGDWSSNRLIPDIIRSYNTSKKIIVRNPNYIRPWQHVLDVLNGYLILIQSSFKKTIGGGWNLGPAINDEKSVIDIIKYYKNIISLNYKILDKKNNKNQLYESKYLRLNSSKIRNLIGWKNKLTIDQSLNWTLDWYLNKKNSSLEKNINQIRTFISTNN